ncbi:MAG: hypothetical protein HUU25_07810 [Candidatus Sumerlaeia bacterium]|nr:hypothetical protein [Candidatus Sumerlaeia bacterium]
MKSIKWKLTMEKDACLKALLCDESAAGRLWRGSYFDVWDKMSLDDMSNGHHEITDAIEARIRESL